MNVQSNPAEGELVLESVKVYVLNIEGCDLVRWERETITVRDIISLGGWEESVTVIEVDHENNERTLVIDEVIHLREKHSFGKKHHWKRG